jgi:soluble lytic murein transglycosylase-like protein
VSKRTRNRVLSIVTWLAVAAAALGLNSAFAQYSDAVEQWRPAVAEACAFHGCSTDYILGVIDCESGGNPNAVSDTINPGTGTYDYGLLQISTIWGGQNMTPAEQIWFAAEHLTAGDIWWQCG